MFVIYDRPDDHPDKVVVRKWNCAVQAQPARDCMLHDSIDDARRSLPPGLVCLQRAMADEPQIVETWL